MHGREAVRSYVASLGEEAHEWLLALYVNSELGLLAVDTLARGDVSSCRVPIWRIINHGHLLKACGFILVHNHPSGSPLASMADIRATQLLQEIGRDAELPLLNHFIIAGDDMWIIC
jgi:DNA repair protein RadC